MMIATCAAQKIANEIQIDPATAPQPRRSEGLQRERADHVWMPNHPHATIRSQDRRHVRAFMTPERGQRHNTGNDTPALVPACAFRIIGTSTIALPSRIVTSACHHVMPYCITCTAWVVITTLMRSSAAM